MKTKQFFTMAFWGLMVAVTFTSCEGTLDDIFGEWSSPTGNNNNTKNTVEGLLPGKFQVDTSGTKVQFSKGNLQATYNGSEWSWAFAENQWYYVGDAAANTSINGNGTISGTGSVDLFGWVGETGKMTTYPAKYGISISSDPNDYSTSATDKLNEWGTLAIINGGNTSNSGWRTLTRDEWGYLFKTRTDANQKYGHGRINGVNGMIILPDSWTLPTGLTFSAGNSFWINNYTIDQWYLMEAAGAIFLPAAGGRSDYGAKVKYAGIYGRYWASSPVPETNSAGAVFFASESLNPTSDYWPNYGNSVRLVMTVNE